MASTIKLKNGSGAPLAGDLVAGEPALDLTNKRLYTEDSGGTVIEVGVNPAAEITANAGIALPDGQKATFGVDNDLQIYSDGTNAIIKEDTGGSLYIGGADVHLMNPAFTEYYISAAANGAVTLRHDNALKLATTSTGVDVTGVITTDGMTTSADINFGDNDKAVFGAGSDLQIYHDGSNSRIQEAGTGNLIIRADDFRLQSVAGESYIEADANGAVALRYDNALKLATTATGIDVTGTVTADGLTVDGDASVAGTVGVTADNGTITTGKDSASSRTHWSMYNPNGEVAKWDSNGTDLLHYITDEYKIYTAGNKAFEIDGNGDVSLFEDTGTTAKFFWDASAESLGIGTTAPSYTVSSRNDSAISYPLSLESATLGTVGNTVGMLFGFAGNTYQKGAVIFESLDSNARGKMHFALDDSAGSGNVQLSDAKMTIDYTGNVGIGTTSPTSKLTIGTGTFAAAGASTSAMYTDASVGLVQLADGYSWNTRGGTERARLDSSGNWLVGTTDTTPYNNNTSTSADKGICLGDGFISTANYNASAADFNRTGTDGNIVNFYKNGSAKGSISITSSAVAYNTSSDQRLKDNIADANDAGDKIDAIKVRQYDWKADGSHQDYGMVAQELMTVAPEAVSGDPESDEMMGVDYSKLVPMLVKEIQSLRARVAQLETN